MASLIQACVVVCSLLAVMATFAQSCSLTCPENKPTEFWVHSELDNGCETCRSSLGMFRQLCSDESITCSDNCSGNPDRTPVTQGDQTCYLCKCGEFHG